MSFPTKKTASYGRLLAILNMLNIEVTSMLATGPAGSDDNDPEFVARVTQACKLLGLNLDDGNFGLPPSHATRSPVAHEPRSCPTATKDLTAALQDAAAAVTAMATVTSACNALTAAGVLQRPDTTTSGSMFNRNANASTSRPNANATTSRSIPSPPPLPEEEEEEEEEQPPEEEEVEGRVDSPDEVDLWDGEDHDYPSDNSETWGIKQQVGILAMSYEEYSEA